MSEIKEREQAIDRKAARACNDYDSIFFIEFPSAELLSIKAKLFEQHSSVIHNTRSWTLGYAWNKVYNELPKDSLEENFKHYAESCRDSAKAALKEHYQNMFPSLDYQNWVTPEAILKDKALDAWQAPFFDEVLGKFITVTPAVKAVIEPILKTLSKPAEGFNGYVESKVLVFQSYVYKEDQGIFSEVLVGELGTIEGFQASNLRQWTGTRFEFGVEVVKSWAQNAEFKDELNTESLQAAMSDLVKKETIICKT